jgi:hypothetical protein
MILEYAQLLSTAHRVLDGFPCTTLSKSGRRKQTFQLADSRDAVLYSATHINHPSAVWVRQSSKNYVWLYQLFTELLKEYTHRYHKLHACEKLVDTLSALPTHIPEGEFTEPTPAMPEEYRVPGDSIQSYKNYYLGDKSHMFSWKNRETPSWIR